MTATLSDPPVEAPPRWVGTGHSTAADADEAGAEAVAAAVAGRDAALLLVFCSVSYDLPALLDAVRRGVGPDTVIAGCSSMGQLTRSGPVEDAVVVMALGGAFEVHSTVSRGLSGGRREAGVEVAACLSHVQLPQRLMVLLCDGTTGQQHEIVRGAYSVLGATVPLVGACAADELTYTGTYQFHGDGAGVEVLSDAVVGVALGSAGPIGVGVEHGWSKAGAPMAVTSSSQGCVQELDGRPALDVYLERTGLDRALARDEHAFRAAAFGQPLGLSRRSGEDIRVIHAADADTGTLTCLADVPQGALAWVMEGDPDLLIQGGIDSCRAAVDALGGAPLLGLLVIDCGARKGMLGEDGLRQEVAQLVHAAGPAPMVGMYTYGEIARTSGARGMHHLTCVCLALG